MELVYELVWIVLMNVFETSAMVIVFSKFSKQLLNRLAHRINLIFVLSIINVTMVLFNLPFKEIVFSIVLIAILKWKFDLSLKKIIVICVLGISYTLIFQLIIVSIFKVLGIAADNYFIGISCNVLLVVIALFTYFYVPLDKAINLYDRFETIILWLIVLIAVPLGIYTMAWKTDFESINYISWIIAGIILWTSIVVMIFRELIRIKQDQKANEIYMEYNPILENLISDVKAKQHDIKNQLHAIYGIAERTGDDEVINYLDTLIGGYQFKEDDTLLNTGNKVVSSILYSKKIKAKQHNIDLSVNCHSPFPDYPIKEYEFVDILGNLLDNAIEANTKKEQLSDKSIHIKLDKNDNYNIIEVKNTSEPMNIELLSKIFDKGYSTKGNNRGYGLYNVKKIVKSKNGKIEVFYENNSVCFKILFEC